MTKMKKKRIMKMKMQIRKTMKMKMMTMKKKMKMISAAGVRVCGPEQRVGWLAAVVRGGRTPHTVGVARHHQPPLLGPLLLRLRRRWLPSSTERQ